MSDIFISYARPNEVLAKQAGDALRAAGYAVWRDNELPAHRAYTDVIEERITAAKAVLVLWSNDAVRSQWVRAEADAARGLGTLVQVSVDGSLPPMPFNQIQCADLFGWTGDTSWPGWAKVVSSISSLVGSIDAMAGSTHSSAPERRVVMCVLPFINMSGDAEQEYFSDGISEDIITDLSKVSALTIIGRNTAFALKGKPVDLGALGRDHGATHVLEGSVRKAGTRVRINAQMTDGASGHQVWADRYDRDLTDIFAIQDEISKAIVGALKLKLLPKEKKAIEQRGTSSPEAYNLYLLARQHWINGGGSNDERRNHVVIRVCRQATAVDPRYARAWALMALSQSQLRFWHGREEDALPAAERAMGIDPTLPEPYCVRARYLQEEGRVEEANQQLEAAQRLDPESWEVNKETAFLIFRQGRIQDAIPYFEKAASLMDTDYHDAGMLMTCYRAINDRENERRVAEMTVSRAERAVAQDPSNGTAMAMGAGALGALGDAARAREWIDRALLIDPDNILLRYNLACSLILDLDDADGALEMLAPYFEQATLSRICHAEVDPDLDSIRDNPSYQAMVAAARTRLDASGEIDAAPVGDV